MRLSLRIMAEGSGRDDRLGQYLDDPRRLFIPARLLLGIIPVLAAALLARVTGVDQAGFPLLVLSILAFVLVCEHVIPLIIVRRDPERVLDVLLPSFDAVARLLSPITPGAADGSAPARAASVRRPTATPQMPTATSRRRTEPQNGERRAARRRVQAREMLRTLVDFRETMVREVMTPRPDIVAVDATPRWSNSSTCFASSSIPASRSTRTPSRTSSGSSS